MLSDKMLYLTEMLPEMLFQMRCHRCQERILILVFIERIACKSCNFIIHYRIGGSRLIVDKLDRGNALNIHVSRESHADHGTFCCRKVLVDLLYIRLD